MVKSSCRIRGSDFTQLSKLIWHVRCSCGWHYKDRGRLFIRKMAAHHIAIFSKFESDSFTQELA